MNYKNLILKIKKKKYQNYLNLDKNFYTSYNETRLQTIKKLENKKDILKTFKIFKSKQNGVIHTFETLYLLFEKFKKNKTFEINDIKIIYSFYKKFEINLILRKEYNKKFNKISNKETNLNSYILLALFIRKLKNINLIQKINCIIKINDHLIINKYIPYQKIIKKIFIENMKYEIQSVQKLKRI